MARFENTDANYVKRVNCYWHSIGKQSASSRLGDISINTNGIFCYCRQIRLAASNIHCFNCRLLTIISHYFSNLILPFICIRSIETEIELFARASGLNHRTIMWFGLIILVARNAQPFGNAKRCEHALTHITTEKTIWIFIWIYLQSEKIQDKKTNKH